MAETTAAPNLILHHLESSQSRRTYWALEELASAGKLTYDVKKYARGAKGESPELQKLTTQGTAPVLTLEYPDGKTVNKLESRLIINWLNDNYGDGMWTPASEEDRERDLFWQEYCTATLAPRIDFAGIFDIIPEKTPWFARPLMLATYSPVGAILKQVIPRFLRPLEDALKEKPWFAGDKIGVSDILMSWPFDRAFQRDYVDKNTWPKITEWYERCTSRECYKRVVEKGGKYEL